MPEIDIVLGNKEKKDIVKYVEQYIENLQRRTDFDRKEPTPIVKVADISKQQEFDEYGCVTYTEKSRTTIKIQDGCNNFCTYCLIPYARGRIRSRKRGNILKEAENIAKQGIKEIVLTGIHIASYGRDFEEEYKLIDLLEDLNKIEGIERIRLGSLEPTIVTEDFARRLSKLNKICNHFHLSLQSGCNETLKRMNRKYTTEEFKQVTERLRKYFKDVNLTTDIIVGFPGETERDFEETLDVVEKVNFEQVFMFIYSKRVGTPAEKMENQIPEEIKHIRFEKLKQLVESQIKVNNEKYIGSIQNVLVEGESKNNEKMMTGRTETNKVVNFESDDKSLIGKVIKIKIISEHMWYLKGKI